MKTMNRTWVGLVILAGVVFMMSQMRASSSSAQPTVAVDAAVALGRAITTQVATIKVDNQRGEPRTFTGRVRFDGPVQAYWVAVVGADIQFVRTEEKQVNRQLFSVDPFAKIINGNEVEVSGKLGIRDGSGDWDDPYQGTLTIAVTAVLAGR